jgi:hypothetical protein
MSVEATIKADITAAATAIFLINFTLTLNDDVAALGRDYGDNVRLKRLHCSPIVECGRYASVHCRVLVVTKTSFSGDSCHEIKGLSGHEAMLTAISYLTN